MQYEEFDGDIGVGSEPSFENMGMYLLAIGRVI